MKLSLEHERLVRMLRESISLMCKSALTYDSELNIEGLLGITLDKHDVFLVNINSNFQQEHPVIKQKHSNDDSISAEDEVESNGSDSYSDEEKSPSRRKRRRRHKNRSRDDDSKGRSGEESNPVSLSESPNPKLEHGGARPSCEFSGLMSQDTLSDFHDPSQGSSSADQPAVFIKKEVLSVDDDNDLSNFGDLSSGDFNQSGSLDIGSGAGQLPYPVSGPVPAMAGDSSLLRYQQQAGATFQQDTSMDAGPSGSRFGEDSQSAAEYGGEDTLFPIINLDRKTLRGIKTCPLCGKHFSSSAHMRRHYRFQHMRVGGLQCQYCPLVARDRFNLNAHMKAAHGVEPTLTDQKPESGIHGPRTTTADQ